MRFFRVDHGLTCLTILFTLVSLIGFYFEGKSANAFMAQCKADGHREYECETMFRHKELSPTFIQIPVPVRVR